MRAKSDQSVLVKSSSNSKEILFSGPERQRARGLCERGGAPRGRRRGRVLPGQEPHLAVLRGRRPAEEAREERQPHHARVADGQLKDTRRAGPSAG